MFYRVKYNNNWTGNEIKQVKFFFSRQGFDEKI